MQRHDETGGCVAFNEDLSDWDAFLRDWPIERLRSMTLAEYATVGDKRCFTYLVERGLDGYGGMRGGTALKFGIYAHRSGENDEKRQENVTYSANYAWYSRFGGDEESVFQKVRDEVAAIAQAAVKGDFSPVDSSADDGLLWPVFRSKIAFLYQDRSAPRLTAVLSPQSLRRFLGLPANDATPITQLHARVLQQKQAGESLIAFSERVWETAKPPEEGGTFSAASAMDYLSRRFPGSYSGTSHLAAYRTPSGRQLAFDPGSNPAKKIAVQIFVDAVPPFGSALTVTEYPPEKSRNHHLKSHAPALAAGERAFSVNVASAEALTQLCDWYDSEISQTAPSSTSSIVMPINQPLNQILFGPPGTGKTFHTIDKAVAILDPAFYSARNDEREPMKQRFDELTQEGLVRFVTFHQSFSYEDFVEGIRADSEGGSLQYRVEPGVFRSICEDARGSSQIASDIGVREGARIWKISIDGTVTSTTRNYCFNHGEARIGWSEAGDLMNENLSSVPAYAVLGSNDRSSLHGFSREIEPGDVLLCIGSEDKFQAVGVVQGEYEYQASPPAGVRQDYVNVLPVNWLATGLSLDIRPLNDGRKFTLKTVYELSRFGWPELAEYLEAASVSLTKGEHEVAKISQPRVLIIDEINRGNISRIFGELITLIEPSKRKGSVEALEVVLPYSKKKFSVPDNVYLIGTMNTADRSLAGLDIALRRRFVFEEMPPKPNLLGTVDGIDLQKLLTTMNQRIEVLLGRDYLLGHAYFIGIKSVADLKDVFQRQVLPLLQEYFFEDWEKIALVLNDHRKAADHRFLSQPGNDLQALFGKEGVANSNPRWNINTKAFIEPESYLGIYSAAGPAP
ncbi:McrB [Lysobacter oculi]|uniref:McrB n=1 Tax=Solilutibacter oculi TaxID=2698682 RepID=A0A344J629_9GAMM|nr:AAA family ATPase [Lysobacter oculi]AXA84489.1 McrB [Lysobacter oculi]